MTPVAGVRTETFATILLSAAALCTSWAGYQATLWSGEQSRYGSETSALRTKSSRAVMAAGQLMLLDVGLFNTWLRERVDGDQRLARYVEGRFRPEFRPAFDAWMESRPLESPAGPSSPFQLPVYRLSALDSAGRYDRAADSTSALSRTANQVGDDYVLAAVILATVLFFATSAQQTDRPSLRWTMLLLAFGFCAVGVYRLLTLPRA